MLTTTVEQPNLLIQGFQVPYSNVYYSNTEEHLVEIILRIQMELEVPIAIPLLYQKLPIIQMETALPPTMLTTMQVPLREMRPIMIHPESLLN